MAREWSWDLGPDGIVKLVVDEQAVETIYRDGRIVARSPKGGATAGHVVVLPPRMPTSDAFRDAAVPSRELRLHRVREFWNATLEGREVAPTSVPAPEELPLVAPTTEGAQKRSNVLRIAVGVIAALVVFACVSAAVSGAMTGALARWSLAHASHQTALTKTWSSANQLVTVTSPSDFVSADPGPLGVIIERKGNAEMYLALMIPNPRTTDLAEVAKVAAEAGLKKLPAGYETSRVSAPVAGDCNGEDGQVVTGTISGAASPVSLKLWLCASLRPGLTIGLRAPSIQIFTYTVPEALETRDKPTLLAMIKQTKFDDTAATTASQATTDPFGGPSFDAFQPKGAAMPMGVTPPPVRTVYIPTPPRTPRPASLPRP